MGGQVGDTGDIRGANGRFIVTNTIRVAHGMTLHEGKVIEGSMNINDKVETEVESLLDIGTCLTAMEEAYRDLGARKRSACRSHPRTCYRRPK